MSRSNQKEQGTLNTQDAEQKITRIANIDETHITITEDKLRLILTENLNNSLKRGDWIGPCGFFLALLIALITVDNFRSVFWINAIYWRAIFVVSTALSFFWTIKKFIQNIKYEKITVDSIVKKVKNKLGPKNESK